MEHYDLIVIGGVAAGTKAAAKTRREKRDWRIAVVTSERDISYAGCGLPYYLGGTIPSRDHLVVKTPEGLSQFSNLEIMTGHQAISIDREAKSITVKNLDTNETFQMGYGKLFLATGASAIVPPIPGSDLENVFTLRSVTDADKIKSRMEKMTGHATIIGAGFIGIEMAENLKEKGWCVTVVEMLPQILPPFDSDIAMNVEKQLSLKGVKVLTGHQVKEIHDGEPMKVIAGDTSFETDMVIMSIGVRPNSEIAKEAGLELGVRGAIKVNPQGQTTDSAIYSSGDCATTFGAVSGNEVWAPMGSTANKQARIAALNFTGDNVSFGGVLGTMAVKAFDYHAAKTGINEREAREAGMDIITAIAPANDRAHYYPGNNKIVIKLVAERGSGRILGAQACGHGVVDKPIDAIAVALTMKATVFDLANVDFVYAPPFSTAVNPVNLACHVMINKMTGRLQGLSPAELKALIDDPAWGGLLLDTRTEPEYMIGTIPGATHIPLDELVARQSEIDDFKDKEIIMICNHGKDAYEASLRLQNLGFIRAKVLEGGTRFWPYSLE